MPSSSPKQARFMRAVAHDPAFAAKVGVPQKVGEEFNTADEVAAANKRLTVRTPDAVKAAKKRLTFRIGRQTYEGK